MPGHKLIMIDIVSDSESVYGDTRTARLCFNTQQNVFFVLLDCGKAITYSVDIDSIGPSVHLKPIRRMHPFLGGTASLFSFRDFHRCPSTDAFAFIDSFFVYTSRSVLPETKTVFNVEFSKVANDNAPGLPLRCKFHPFLPDVLCVLFDDNHFQCFQLDQDLNSPTFSKRLPLAPKNERLVDFSFVANSSSSLVQSSNACFFVSDSLKVFLLFPVFLSNDFLGGKVDELLSKTTGTDSPPLLVRLKEFLRLAVSPDGKSFRSLTQLHHSFDHLWLLLFEEAHSNLKIDTTSLSAFAFNDRFFVISVSLHSDENWSILSRLVPMTACQCPCWSIPLNPLSIPPSNTPLICVSTFQTGVCFVKPNKAILIDFKGFSRLFFAQKTTELVGQITAIMRDSCSSIEPKTHHEFLDAFVVGNNDLLFLSINRKEYQIALSIQSIDCPSSKSDKLDRKTVPSTKETEESKKGILVEHIQQLEIDHQSLKSLVKKCSDGSQSETETVQALRDFLKSTTDRYSMVKKRVSEFVRAIESEVEEQDLAKEGILSQCLAMESIGSGLWNRLEEVEERGEEESRRRERVAEKYKCQRDRLGKISSVETQLLELENSTRGVKEAVLSVG